MSILNNIKCLYYNIVVQNLWYCLYYLNFFNIIIVNTQKDFCGHFQSDFVIKLSNFEKFNSLKCSFFIKNYFYEIQKLNLFCIVKITGSGFFNFLIDYFFISKYLNFQIKKVNFGIKNTLNSRNIIVDFSSPNVAKEMHIGHLRSTILGDCISTSLRLKGHKVIRLNHLGDWGTQFGVLVFYLKRVYPCFIFFDFRYFIYFCITILTYYYKKSNEYFFIYFFKLSSYTEVLFLQQMKNINSYLLWKEICFISKNYFKHLYMKLNIKLIDRGESFYNFYFLNMLQILQKKNLLRHSRGAKCISIFLENSNKHFNVIIHKRRGGFNYMATDLASFSYRIFNDKGEFIIYITDIGQVFHFKSLFFISEKIFFINTLLTSIHVTFGAILNSFGTRMKSREGNVVSLRNLFNKIAIVVQNIMNSRYLFFNSVNASYYANRLAMSGLKYVDFSCNRDNSYVFDVNTMFFFTGNTIIAMYYCYARIQSILRKSFIQIDFLLKYFKIKLTGDKEVNLSLFLGIFSEFFMLFFRRFCPHYLIDYMFSLSEVCNCFFYHYRILDSKDEYSRVLLCFFTGGVIKKCCDILGLAIVNTI